MNADWSYGMRSPLADVIDFHCRAEPEHISRDEIQTGFDITFVRSGTFLLNHGSRSWHVDSRSIVLSNAGAAFRVGHGREAGDVCTVVRVDAGVLREIRDRFWTKSGSCEEGPAGAEMIFPRAVLPSTPDLDLMHHGLFRMTGDRSSGRTSAFEERVTALVEHVVARSYGRMHAAPSAGMPEPAPPHQLEAVERARTFMLEHFREDLSVRRIASEACLSPYHFIRSFKAATGETPYRYLRRVRLSNARFLLRTTDSSVTRIAHDSGFASLSHFSDAFSAETGASPTDFRRGG